MGQTIRPNPWAVRLDRISEHREQRLRNLKYRFNAASHSWRRGTKFRKIIRKLALIAVLTAAAVFAPTVCSEQSVVTKRNAKAPNGIPKLHAARAVGLAPAYKGQPGYWEHNDRDRDGIACEPYRPRLRH
jgi:hypothetical protein